MAELSRYSVIALKKETTEGTPVVPASGSDFTALQDGFSFEPNFQVLDNAELKASIGKAKSVLGLEQPKGSFKHYLRHSGVEGQAPDFHRILEAAFGQETVAGTEYPTVASSTISQVKVNTGIGANFQRGQALLVKDGTNGYSIRNILSVSGDNLNLGFNLATAPAAAINLGKSVLYSVLQTGHPTLTLWEYRANGGALEVLAGARPTNLSIDVKAGEMISMSCDFEGTKYHFNPINITATDIDLDFLDDATTRVAAISAKLYRDPLELAQALQDSMNSLGSSNTFTVSYSSSTGKFTIASTGTTLTLKFSTGANAANTIGDKIGFSVVADKSGALTYSSDTAQSWAASLTPSYDSADPLVAKDNEILIGSATDNVSVVVSSMSFKLQNSKANVPSVASSSGISGSIIKQRQVSADVTAILSRNDVDKFKRFRNNDDTSFQYNFGVKSGGNWVAGKCGSLYLPDCSISSFKLEDLDGVVAMTMTLQAFVDSNGNGEVYLNFV